jgi:tetratricopeptide (TPR) repeat protein
VTHPRGLLLVFLLVLSTLSASGSPAVQSTGPPVPPGKLTAAESAALERRLLDAVQREPASFAAHQALAQFYLQRDRLDAALPHLARAQAIDPAHYANGYDLALALLQTGRLDEARAQIRRVLTIKDAAELHNLLGDVDERAGNLVAAAEAYQRAAHMDATEEHLFDWGNSFVQMRAFEQAGQVFTAAVARHPKSARLHVGLGIAQYSRGQYEDAVASFCQAVDLAPSDPRAYQFLGEMYGVAPELAPEITKRLARFVEARPRNALAHLYYALSLWKGLPGEAEPADMRRVEALLRRAIALDPKLSKGFLELGILLSEQQRYKEAVQELRRATRLDPDHAQAHYRLAQAYQRTGQEELARVELQIFERLKASSR